MLQHVKVEWSLVRVRVSHVNDVCYYLLNSHGSTFSLTLTAPACTLSNFAQGIFQSKRQRELTSNYNSDDLKSLHVLRSTPQDATLIGCPWVPEVLGEKFKFSTAWTFIFQSVDCSFLLPWQWNWTWLLHEGHDIKKYVIATKCVFPCMWYLLHIIHSATGSIEFLPGDSTTCFV